ncbi:MAG: DUF5596 domain-containing protein [Lachnospiraceae bacterium]|nr:DUF5596 domain-containing protein [Lachnospiraceae bacterium]
MTLEGNRFCQRLNITFSEELIPYYEKGVRLKKELGNCILDKDRLIRLNNRYQIFRKHFPKILEAADAVLQDRDLVLHTYILLGMIMEEADLQFLEFPDRQRMDTDFAPMFAILYFLEDMIADMEKRGVPYQVISDTLNGFEIKVDDYYNIY